MMYAYLYSELPTQLLAEMEGSGLDLEADFSGALPLHVQRRSAHRRRGQNRKQKFGRSRGQGQKHLEDDDSTNEDTELVGKIKSFECLHALSDRMNMNMNIFCRCVAGS